MADDWAAQTIRISDVTGTFFADVTTDGVKVDISGGLVTDGGSAGTTGLHILGTDGTNAQIISTNATGHVNIADGGNIISVDGTVTADAGTGWPEVVTDGAAAGTTGLHVLGTDGTNAQIISTNATGHVNIADGGNSITVDGAFPPTATDGATAGTVGIHVLGTDGTDAQILSTNVSGHVNIADGGNSITIDGTVTANAGTGTFAVSGTVTANAGTGTFTVDGSGVTQPVSGTVTANAGTGVFDVTPASPAAADYLPVRLTDGSGFYSSAASVGVTAAKLDTINSGDLAPAASATTNGTQIASGKTGKLMGATFSSSVPGKYELKTVLNGVATLREVFFLQAGETFHYTPPTKDFITVAESATAGADAFAVTYTNMEPVGGNTASLYSSLSYDEI